MTDAIDNDELENENGAEDEGYELPEGCTYIEATGRLKVDGKPVGDRRTAQFHYNFKGTAQAAIDAFGADIVYSGFVRSMKIDAQSRMRSLIEAGKNPDEVADNMFSSWYPGAKSVAGATDVMAAFSRMTPEEQAETIAKMQAAAAALANA